MHVLSACGSSDIREKLICFVECPDHFVETLSSPDIGTCNYLVLFAYKNFNRIDIAEISFDFLVF